MAVPDEYYEYDNGTYSDYYGNETLVETMEDAEGETGTLIVNSPWDDVTWVLTSAFLIFTMQSGN